MIAGNISTVASVVKSAFHGDHGEENTPNGGVIEEMLAQLGPERSAS